MSKEVIDILGVMQGNFIALKGMYTKLAPRVPPSNPTIEQEAYPLLLPIPEAPDYEDYLFVKRLLSDIESHARDASAAIDKALKVPQQPKAGPSNSPLQTQGESHSSKEKEGAKK